MHSTGGHIILGDSQPSALHLRVPSGTRNPGFTSKGLSDLGVIESQNNSFIINVFFQSCGTDPLGSGKVCYEDVDRSLKLMNSCLMVKLFIVKHNLLKKSKCAPDDSSACGGSWWSSYSKTQASGVSSQRPSEVEPWLWFWCCTEGHFLICLVVFWYNHECSASRMLCMKVYHAELGLICGECCTER